MRLICLVLPLPVSTQLWWKRMSLLPPKLSILVPNYQKRNRPLTSLVFGSLIVLSLIASLSMGIMFLLLRMQRQQAQESIQTLTELLRDYRRLNESLMLKLIARDPMTLATLTQIEHSGSDTGEILAPVGTDEAEFLKWQASLQGTPYGDMAVSQDEDGLTDDDAEFFGNLLPEQPEQRG